MNETALKPGWRRVKFGEVVQLSKARSQDPLADGIERYVGLEHLEPGDLRIRSWGNVADGVTFTSVFQPGQVLFGKRRAYQRKVAVADFSGVCSGDIYVLETKDPKVLLPQLLPFICQTDAFFDHAVGTSAGSLSPRTNWTSLAGFEFALPPQDHQKRTVSLLTKVDALADRLIKAVACLDVTVDAFFAEHFAIDGGAERISSKGITVVAVGAVTQSVVPGRTKPREFKGDIPWLVTADLVGPSMYAAPNALLVSDDELRKVGGKVLPPGAVVMTCVGNLGVVSRVHMKCSLNQQLHGFIATPGLIDPEYLAAALRSQRRQITSLANTTTVPYLNKENCESIRIPVPTSIDEQKSLAVHLRQFDVARVVLIDRLNALRSLRSGLLDEVTQ